MSFVWVIGYQANCSATFLSFAITTHIRQCFYLYCELLCPQWPCLVWLRLVDLQLNANNTTINSNIISLSSSIVFMINKI